MRPPREDLALATRKALVARLLRTTAEIGAISETDFLTLQGRIEQALSREELDAIQQGVERAGGARPGGVG